MNRKDSFKIIPAIDILDGRVVRLTQGDYSQIENYAFSPEEIAQTYEQGGARQIHIVDLNGAKEGKLVNFETLKKIRRCVKIELDFGGGVRTEETAKQLLDLGINYITLGSILIKDFFTSQKIIKKFPYKIIAGLDMKNDKIATEGWRKNSNISGETILSKINDLPLKAIIYTDIAKDGMMAGPNIIGLEKLTSLTKIPIIVSGGVSSLKDIENLKKLEQRGVCGCIVGKAILSQKIDLATIF